MNLNINKEEARFISDALAYFIKSTKVPNLLLDFYPGADIRDVLSQLNYIIELGEEPISEETKNIFQKKVI